MICGVTSVSSCLDNISIRGGIIISLLGGVLYFILSKVYLKLEIDDPLESSILYGWMGVFSSIVVGFVH
jgi:ammonia channel protein AmtB